MCDDVEVVDVQGPKCVQSLRVGEMVDQGVCVKHSGVMLGETRLAFWSMGWAEHRKRGCCSSSV